MSRYRIQLALLIITCLVLLLIVFQIISSKTGTPQAEAMRSASMIALPEPRALPTLQLINSEGATLSTDSLDPKWHLLYFGYTYCPDICPTSLAEMRQIHRLLTTEAQRQVTFVMVSVDPQRDTPQQLHAYLAFFSPDFQGWTGEMENIQRLSSAVGIPFIPGDTSQPGYTIDHSGNLAIINPQGQHFGFIQAPFKIEQVATQLNQWVQQTIE